ncbi:TniB family NTP-binding protein [Agromyces sp. Leaf222]|uniref:TniB family NTP-binding protein n=1 Tax=Agromyces sp. Leaf222 TaxID=1735688 RepID=UPI0006F9451E|nr:TniB family NTP-binding protein [Agromyces sp. Leaf222]KQM82412.1 hypothetical protein ASE68_03190 [Agromyces sp. Leaf222]
MNEPTDRDDEHGYGHFDRRETLLALLTEERPGKPEASLAEYLTMTEDQRLEFNDDRIDFIIHGKVVKTPPLQELGRLLERALRIARRPVGRGGLILTGPPTMGKTTASLQAMRSALHRHEAEYPEWRSLDHTPVVYIEVPPGSTAKALMGRILGFFGHPVPPRMTLEERTQAVVYHLNRGRTSLLVIDEMQNLAKLTQGSFETAQAIKDLTNGIRAVPMLVGIDLDKTIITTGTLGEQFASRSKTVSLGRLGWATDEERKVWLGAIYAFETNLCLLAHPPRALFPHAELLWNLTRGSISALASLLTTAAMDLIDADDPENETITPDVIAGIRLDLTTEREIARVVELEAKVGAKRQKKIRDAA